MRLGNDTPILIRDGGRAIDAETRARFAPGATLRIPAVTSRRNLVRFSKPRRSHQRGMRTQKLVAQITMTVLNVDKSKPSAAGAAL
jgi:hypothetical protein